MAPAPEGTGAIGEKSTDNRTLNSPKIQEEAAPDNGVKSQYDKKKKKAQKRHETGSMKQQELNRETEKKKTKIRS